MIVLKGNPLSTNSLYRYACRGRHPCMYMTKEGKALKEQYQWEMKAQGKKMKGKLHVSIYLYFGDKRKRDIDNYNKILLDSGNGILWEDDSQIAFMEISKDYDKNSPRIELDIGNF